MKNERVTPIVLGILLAMVIILGIHAYYLAQIWRDTNRLAILGRAWYTNHQTA